MAGPLAIKVSCRAGFRGEESPTGFVLGENSVSVAEILDCWLAPEHRYFKVRGSDGALYILRHDVNTDLWELCFYTRESTRVREP